MNPKVLFTLFSLVVVDAAPVECRTFGKLWEKKMAFLNAMMGINTNNNDNDNTNVNINNNNNDNSNSDSNNSMSSNSDVSDNDMSNSAMSNSGISNGDNNGGGSQNGFEESGFCNGASCGNSFTCLDDGSCGVPSSPCRGGSCRPGRPTRRPQRNTCPEDDPNCDMEPPTYPPPSNGSGGCSVDDPSCNEDVPVDYAPSSGSGGCYEDDPSCDVDSTPYPEGKGSSGFSDSKPSYYSRPKSSSY
ncbi:hypothetical protein DSO57_1031418 [Entomophthora muscae]|uniref:Uncharacterized protein n=1 Tax=Entomophthora muscae TaxID=34485 RepID=A0ACC2SDL4_9FUNG|nr:hypothetical protein DSO57_1031418 [Entomophthora muscae]